MKFKYKKVPLKGKAFCFRPIIPVSISINPSDVKYLALIDSGSDENIFHADLGEILNIKVKEGLEKKIGGISGAQISVFFHKVRIEVGGYSFECWCGFSYQIPKFGYGVLGQKGFFEFFKTTFDYQKREIELKPKEFQK